jgi:hypothetical protein
MRLPNQWFPALHKRINRLEFRRLAYALSLSLIVFAFAGCAGGTSGTGGFASFFRSDSPTPTATVTPTPTPVASATPVAAETTGHPSKRTARQARAASENAAAASKEAANASAAAARASKQAASVANSIEGTGPTNADVSLENSSAPAGAVPAAAVSLRTPLASPSAPTSGNANAATVARSTPTLTSSGLESSEPPGEPNPARAARLIQTVDKIETRVDRKNLDADDSQRDILAQRLLQEAKKSLADHDSVAAISLATKASTLLEPLPKLADSSIPSAP